MPLAPKRRVQPIEHAIERCREASDLVAGGREAQSARQVVRPDRRRRPRDAVDGIERPAGQKQPTGARQQQRDRHDQRHE